ncbi:uncharacterized protein [Nicotiana tomentosiformis]|uniref:uncharacterized protein n=1 Tax=Nicotiana tomentosiformis TaxID=4098 RepID=UPI00388C3AD9
MRSLFEEENEDSEDDYDNVALASFIKVRSRQETPQELTSERPTTRLQKQEALESVVPPSLVVDIDDEVDEEPGSLVRKSSKKLTILKSKKESSLSEMGLSNVAGEKSGEQVVDKSDEKAVAKSGKKVTEESVEQVSEKKVSEKSTEKRKSARKSVKRKAGDSEEPGSSKKAKVGATQDAGSENLRNQKVGATQDATQDGGRENLRNQNDRNAPTGGYL